MRWLLLDDVIIIQKKQFARTRSRVPPRSGLWQGSAQASPELLMMEMMAQTGALLLGAENNFEEDVVFAKIQEAAFQPGLQPGELIEIEITSESLRPEGAWMDGSIQNSRGEAGRAKFFLVNVGHLVPDRNEPVTFHDAFMNAFQIRDKVK